MNARPPSTDPKVWFHRSLALTLAVGACVVLLFAVRPGYGAFFVTSTLAFLVAGLLWNPGDPPLGGRRKFRHHRPTSLGGQLDLARSYRISTSR